MGRLSLQSVATETLWVGAGRVLGFLFAFVVFGSWSSHTDVGVWRFVASSQPTCKRDSFTAVSCQYVAGTEHGAEQQLQEAKADGDSEGERVVM